MDTLSLILVLTAACVAVAALVVLLARRDRELSRIASELDRRDPASNARIALGVRSPGLVRLARAVNGQLDRERDRHVAEERERRSFQEDLASLSHDIRTPLAGAQGYLQLAQRTADPERRARYVGQTIERLDAMRGLVDGLFDYAKASDPSLELALARVELLPALSEVLVGFYPDFSARGWEPAIRFADEGAAVRADAASLARVLTNLTTNALRYGCGAPSFEQAPADAGGAVLLRAANPVSRPDLIDADRLFDRFYKAEASRAGAGNGLGLAIVAKLVAAMGGSVAARIEAGSLVIEVALPAAE